MQEKIVPWVDSPWNSKKQKQLPPKADLQKTAVGNHGPKKIYVCAGDEDSFELSKAEFKYFNIHPGVYFVCVTNVIPVV